MFWFFAACAAPDPTAALPDEGFFASTGTALGQAAECLSGFPASPAAKAAERWRELALSCPGEVYGTGPLAALEVRCQAAPAEVLALRQGKAAAFGAPRTAAGVVHGTLSAPTTTGWQAEIRVPLPDELGPLSLVIPAAEGPGPNVLSNAKAVVHARIRPESGIDIASLVPADTQADNLFNLKSALLSRAVLSGTWELAIYPAPKGQIMPQVALSVGVHAAAAGPALDTFATQLREKWNVQRVPTSVGAWQGECIRGMRILPGLEPCWLMDDQSLVIGWNQTALEQGVGGAPTPLDLGGRSGMALDFAAMAMADALLAAEVQPVAQFAPIRYPGTGITLSAAREGNELVALLESDQPCEP